MSEKPPTVLHGPADAFQRKIAAMEERKLKAQRQGVQGIWMGLGTFGLIGWSVALPTFFGVLLGTFIDDRFPGIHSWTLSLLVLGLFVGCLNAWHWVAREEKAIRDNKETKDE